MRTTISMDEDVHEFATIYAKARGISLSKAVDELIRKAEAEPRPAAEEICFSPSGLPMFPPRGGIITEELVKKLDEEDFDPQLFT